MIAPRRRKLDAVLDTNLVEQYHTLYDETKLDWHSAYRSKSIYDG